jgi:hypothetical protein
VYRNEVNIGPCSHKDLQEGFILVTNLQSGESVNSEEENIGLCSNKDSKEGSTHDTKL